MRIRINLDLTDKSIPVNYCSLIQGLIYNSFPNTEEIKTLHDEGTKFQKEKFKLFTFSEIYGNARYDNETKSLIFSDKGYFDFTAFNENLVKYLIDYLEMNKSIILGNNVINVINYELLDDSISNLKEIKYTTESPVLVYVSDERRTIYLSPEDDNYKDILLNNIIKKVYVCFNILINKEQIEIEIENVKKKVCKFRKNVFIGYHYNITLKNINKYIQSVIMTTGIGSKNSMGFGMLNKN